MKDEPDNLTVRVNLFGGLVISCQSTTLSDVGRRGKVWDFLEFLLVNRQRGYSIENLIELLCQEDETDNPMSVIKNLAYRLRKLLSQAGFPDREYIVYQQGVYTWNAQIPCVLDCEEFEDRWKQAEAAGQTREKSLALYLEALALYTGRFLPKSTAREWVAPLAAYYHRLYIECIRKAYALLAENQQWERAVLICNSAIVIDPYEEVLYEMLLEALIGLGRYTDALEAYDRITSLLFNELGVTPSERIRSFYTQIVKAMHPEEKDIDEISIELAEPLAPLTGAYQCDYEIFKTVYRYTARTMERSEKSVFLLVFTLTGQNGPLETKPLKIAMGHLQGVISGSLRKGDAYSRYSATQYIVMLSEITTDNCRMVAGRILERFSRTPACRFSNLSYKLNPVNVLIE